MKTPRGQGRSLILPETFLDGKVTQYCGDVLTVLRTLPADHFDCVVTSPPYWGLRDYGTGRWEGGAAECQHDRINTSRTPWANSVKGPGNPGKNGSDYANMTKIVGGHCSKCEAKWIDGQIGLERSLGEHLAVMVEVFAEVRRVLKPTGTLWLNYGDCYATSPNGRSANDTKAAGNDDRTFRDKPFSTIGAIYSPNHELVSRVGKSENKNNQNADHKGRIVGMRSGAPSEKSTLRGNGHVGGGPKLKALRDVPAVRHGGFLKAKDLCMIPNRLAIALQDDGWWVRSEIIWHKPNPMPESTRDRPTSSHEKIWLMTKAERYFYDADAIAEPASASTHARLSQNVAAQVGSLRANGGMKSNGPMKAVAKGSTRKLAEATSGIKNNTSMNDALALMPEMRNSRNVWTMGTEPFSEAHFATFPPELATRCIKAGSPIGGEVLDIFGGSGTTAMVAVSLGHRATLIELNPEYCILARARIEAAFMGRDEGKRHMVKKLGKAQDAGPLFGGVAP